MQFKVVIYWNFLDHYVGVLSLLATCEHM
uniref:Uncharacterized protein n=1 Tax=Rhizophora mucronata TaxID=61149 RepID=A0A2P2PG23_RHIMU